MLSFITTSNAWLDLRQVGEQIFLPKSFGPVIFDDFRLVKHGKLKDPLKAIKSLECLNFIVNHWYGSVNLPSDLRIDDYQIYREDGHNAHHLICFPR